MTTWPRAFDATCARLAAPAWCWTMWSSRTRATIAAIYLHVALTEAAAFHARTLESRPDDYTPTVRVRLEAGRYVLAEDYLRALRGRDVCAARYRPRSTAATACCCPLWPCPPRRSAPPRYAWARWTNRCATSPCGSHSCSTSRAPRDHYFLAATTGAGLPIGAQLVGSATAPLLQLAASLEAHVRGERPPASSQS
jgi:Asp-tRNA(Asn)/Glu-tRNA(Gln) amidotransferase A subunit family amidase